MAKSTPNELIWLPTGGHLGDAIFITALFAEAIEHNPKLRIRYVVRRNAALITELTSYYPAITVVPLPYHLLPALRTVIGLFIHRAVLMVPPPRNTHPLVIKLLALLGVLRGDVVIGFEDKLDWEFYTHKLTYNKQERYMRNLRKALGLAEIPTNDLDAPPRVSFASALPSDFPFAHKPYIVVHPFPHMATFKTLPLRRWNDLLLHLHTAYPGYGIVLTGADVDRTDADTLAPTLPESVLYRAIGKPFGELAGIISDATLYIGVDTGPTHLAGVQHKTSVIVAQQNEPLWITTYNPNAVHLWSKEECVCGVPGKKCDVVEDGKHYRRCVYFVSDEELYGAIDKKLSEPKSAA